MADFPPPPIPPDPAPDPDSRPQATLFQVVGAVFWSFFGVRKGNAMRRDAVAIRPHQVVIVGVALAVVFVLSLLLLVRIILRAAGG
jgi:preprotein translocase subunit Sec61beta